MMLSSRSGSTVARVKFCILVAVLVLVYQGLKYQDSVQSSASKQKISPLHDYVADDKEDDSHESQKSVAKVAVPFGRIEYQPARLKKRASPPLTNAQWEKARHDGIDYSCLMAMPDEALPAGLKGNPAFSDPNQLANWGWDIEASEPQDVVDFQQNILPVFHNLIRPQLSQNIYDWIAVGLDHTEEWEANGKSGPASEGYYRFLMNQDVNRPVMVVTESYSPEYQLKIDGGDPTQAPDLQRWSDLAFIGYYAAIWGGGLWGLELEDDGTSQIPCPVWVIRHQIEDNRETMTIPLLKRMLQTQGLTLANGKAVNGLEWPGVEFDVTDFTVGQRVLGAAHVKGVAWFLIQHKKQFGVKEIKSVRVWEEPKGRRDRNNRVRWETMLAINIGDVEDENEDED